MLLSQQERRQPQFQALVLEFTLKTRKETTAYPFYGGKLSLLLILWGVTNLYTWLPVPAELTFIISFIIFMICVYLSFQNTFGHSQGMAWAQLQLLKLLTLLELGVRA